MQSYLITQWWVFISQLWVNVTQFVTFLFHNWKLFSHICNFTCHACQLNISQLELCASISKNQTTMQTSQCVAKQYKLREVFFFFFYKICLSAGSTMSVPVEAITIEIIMDYNHFNINLAAETTNQSQVCPKGVYRWQTNGDWEQNLEGFFVVLGMFKVSDLS